MKKILIYIFLLPFITSAQTYEAAFNRLDNALNNGMGYSDPDAYNNLNGDLAWGESYIMMSYMAMYRAMKNESCNKYSIYY